jgi:hypothetical protein
MIQERVRAELRRAKEEGKGLGRPPIASELERRIREALNKPGRTEGVRKIAERFGVNPGTVQRISRPFAGASTHDGSPRTSCSARIALHFMNKFLSGERPFSTARLPRKEHFPTWGKWSHRNGGMRQNPRPEIGAVLFFAIFRALLRKLRKRAQQPKLSTHFLIKPGSPLQFRGPGAGSPAGHQRRKRAAAGCTAAAALLVSGIGNIVTESIAPFA